MSADLKHCAACQFHRLFNGRLHLCTLPPACVPVTTADSDEQWFDREDRMAEYIGTWCDVMRRMGATCGPTGTLWRPIPVCTAEVQP